MKVAVLRSQLISRSTFSTAVAKRHKTQDLATPVCCHARNALCLVSLQLDSHIGHRPLPVFVGPFPSFFEISDTDRQLVLDGFFAFRPPVCFARPGILYRQRIQQNLFAIQDLCANNLVKSWFGVHDTRTGQIILRYYPLWSCVAYFNEHDVPVTSATATMHTSK